MKNRFFLLIIIPLMAACSSESKRAEQNIAVVENYIESVENLDYQTMESLLDEQWDGSLLRGFNQ